MCHLVLLLVSFFFLVSPLISPPSGGDNSPFFARQLRFVTDNSNQLRLDVYDADPKVPFKAQGLPQEAFVGSVLVKVADLLNRNRHELRLFNDRNGRLDSVLSQSQACVNVGATLVDLEEARHILDSKVLTDHEAMRRIQSCEVEVSVRCR